MSRSDPSAILFDVDGTLIDTYELYLESYRRALTPYLGYVPEVEEFVRRRPSSERHFLTDWIGAEAALECRATMNRYYEELHGALFAGAYEGVREMLSALRSAGIPLGIVTGKGRSAWKHTSEVVDLGRFDVVVTDDDVAEPKPHPGGLLTAAEALSVPAAEIVYVGDSLADLEAGRLAGMFVGAALWPKTDEEDRRRFEMDIGAHAPDWRFERPADVTRVFASWC